MSASTKLDPLEVRLRTLLPEQYRDSYQDVPPVSMGSAGLKFAADGSVAWDEMWATFCDLAMAGGPPHKGTLLEAAGRDAIDAEPARYAAVVDEIRRGIRLVTLIDAQPSPYPGWIRITCDSAAMAGWLLRAIVMENVSAHAEGRVLDLPAGPAYRLEKEIKNVVTAIAKTDHYWSAHLSPVTQRTIGRLLASMAADEPLVTPPRPDQGVSVEQQRGLATTIAGAIERETGLTAGSRDYPDWLGMDCGTVDAAIWMMRLLVVCNVLARREGGVVFVPVNPLQDGAAARTVDVVARVHRLAVARGVL